MNKTLAAGAATLVLLPLVLTGCRDRDPQWDVPTRTARECYEDRSNTPCLVVSKGETSGKLYEKGQKAREVRVLWREKDGTWKFADDLHS